MTLFGDSKTMEKDFDLIILTSNMLFQHVEVSFDLLCFLTLQLNNGPAIKADPTVHVEDLTLLFIDSDTDILLHVVDSLDLILCEPSDK